MYFGGGGNLGKKPIGCAAALASMRKVSDSETLSSASDRFSFFLPPIIRLRNDTPFLWIANMPRYYQVIVWRAVTSFVVGKEEDGFRGAAGRGAYVGGRMKDNDLLKTELNETCGTYFLSLGGFWRNTGSPGVEPCSAGE
jgi:hypothetical protein